MAYDKKSALLKDYEEQTATYSVAVKLISGPGTIPLGDYRELMKLVA